MGHLNLKQEQHVQVFTTCQDCHRQPEVNNSGKQRPDLVELGEGGGEGPAGLVVGVGGSMGGGCLVRRIVW